MQEDDLDEGIQKIKDILLRLETRNFDAELLKDFPKPVHAEKPGTIPQQALPEVPAGPPAEAPEPEPQPVQQKPELPAAEPEPPVVKTETPTEAPAEEPRAEEPKPEAPKPEAPRPEEAEPERQPEPQSPAQPGLSGPEPEVVRKTKGPKIKTAAVLFLGVTVAAAVYQFGFNGSKYRYKQASRLEQTGDITKAAAAYERVILNYPGSSEAAASQYSLGKIKSERGEPGAVEYYRKFLRAAPAGDRRIPEAKFKIAEGRFNDGDYFEAGNLYDSADVRSSGYSQKALERLGQIKIARAQAAEAKARLEEEQKRKLKLKPVKAGRPAAAARAKAAAAARTDLARSILLTNRRHLGARAPGKAEPLKTAALKDRYKACYPVWLAEKKGGPAAALSSEKAAYGCDALKESLAACERSQANTRAIKTQTAEERASKVQSVVKDWTVQKQESLDKKMLKLYEENQCAELLELVAQSDGEDALDAF